MSYNTYGNWIPPRDADGNVKKVDLDETNPSLYNITSQYLKELPSQTRQKLDQFLLKIENLLSDENYVQQYPILKQLQDAIEMKQYKKKSQLDLAKNYKEAYYMNIDMGMYTISILTRINTNKVEKSLKSI